MKLDFIEEPLGPECQGEVLDRLTVVKHMEWLPQAINGEKEVKPREGWARQSVLHTTVSREYEDMNLSRDFISRASDVSISNEGYIDASRDSISRASDIHKVRVAQGSVKRNTKGVKRFGLWSMRNKDRPRESMDGMTVDFQLEEEVEWRNPSRDLVVVEQVHCRRSSQSWSDVIRLDRAL